MRSQRTGAQIQCLMHDIAFLCFSLPPHKNAQNKNIMRARVHSRACVRACVVRVYNEIEKYAEQSSFGNIKV